MTFEDDLQALQSLSWCRRFLEDPDMVILPFWGRTDGDGNEDALMAKTLNTEDTIKRGIYLHKKPTSNIKYIEEVLNFMTIGSLVNGQPNICHGGIVATILDEVSGFLFVINPDLGHAPGRGYTVTAYLNVSYLKPVTTPQTILTRARLSKMTGRKIYVEGQIEDSDGNVLAKSEGLFVAAKGAKL